MPFPTELHRADKNVAYNKNEQNVQAKWPKGINGRVNNSMGLKKHEKLHLWSAYLTYDYKRNSSEKYSNRQTIVAII